jgi:hypothetical protein
VAVQHAPEEIDPSPSQSSQKGEGPLSRLHFGSLNTIPFQPKIQPCQRYLTFLPYEWKSNPVLSFLHKNQPAGNIIYIKYIYIYIYIFKPVLPTIFEKRIVSPPKMTSPVGERIRN